ncbi:MAG: glycosyltransferase family 1 protein [Aquabacterium sp.]|nr:glycosyltransferase family 1 protein [Aquabacterium sp.]
MTVNRLRVGVDFHEWDGIFQGSRNHVLGIYRAAIYLAPDVDFVFFLESVDSLRSAHAEFRQSNVRLVVMPRRNGLIRLGLQLPWLRWRHRLDILHTQYRVPFIHGGATACTIHDVLFETHPQFFPTGFVREAKITFRMAVRKSDVLFTVSQYSKREICRIYGASEANTRVTYNGVDRTRFYPGAQGADKVKALGLTPGHYALVVGRLEPRKNHLTLMKAWAQLGASAPQLVIVGQEDPSFPEVREAIDAMAEANKVLLLNQLGDDLLPDVMRHASLFVYPAFAEGFGMPVAEAMASGVPVVTSNTTSLPEVAGGGAVLFDPESDSDLLRALRETLSLSATSRQALIDRALEQVRRFDWTLSAGVLLDGLRTAAGASLKH